MSDSAPESDLTKAVSMQGHYAGAVTRLAAFAVDQGIASGLFAAASLLFTQVVAMITNDTVKLDLNNVVTGALFLLWLFAYYSYPWSMSGKTPGMALLGIRVVRADGGPATTRNAVLRTLALPLSFLTLGIGFLPIIFGRHRQALHDRIADTAVVYSWDARGARWRFLARQGEVELPTNPSQEPTGSDGKNLPGAGEPDGLSGWAGSTADSG